MAKRIIAVRRELDVWRRQRTAKNEAVPVALRKRIVNLLQDHPWLEIGRELQLSTCLISKWRVEHGWKSCSRPKRRRNKGRGQNLAVTGRRTVAKPTATTFVEVPSLPGLGGGEVFVEVRGARQATLRIRGGLEPSALRALAEVVVGGNEP
jgi:hypothetical protein